jgi:hypothetical protein
MDSLFWKWWKKKLTIEGSSPVTTFLEKDNIQFGNIDRNTEMKQLYEIEKKTIYLVPDTPTLDFLNYWISKQITSNWEFTSAADFQHRSTKPRCLSGAKSRLFNEHKMEGRRGENTSFIYLFYPFIFFAPSIKEF